MALLTAASGTRQLTLLVAVQIDIDSLSITRSPATNWAPGSVDRRHGHHRCRDDNAEVRGKVNGGGRGDNDCSRRKSSETIVIMKMTTNQYANTGNRLRVSTSQLIAILCSPYFSFSPSLSVSFINLSLSFKQSIYL